MTLFCRRSQVQGQVNRVMPRLLIIMPRPLIIMPRPLIIMPCPLIIMPRPFISYALIFQKKPGTGTGKQSDAPPTYDEALHHETAIQREAAIRGAESQATPTSKIDRSRAESASATPSAPPSVGYNASSSYPQQLAVPRGGYPTRSESPSYTGYNQAESAAYPGYTQATQSPHYPASAQQYPPRTPTSPSQHSSHTPGSQYEQRTPTSAPGYAPYSPNSASQYDYTNRQNEINEHQAYRSPSHEAQGGQAYRTPQHEAQDRHGYNSSYTRSRSHDPDAAYPHLARGPHSTPARDNEYSEPPVPARNYRLQDNSEDDGGFSVVPKSSRRRILSSPEESSNRYRDQGQGRSTDQGQGRPSDPDYYGYAEIPARNTSHSYHNRAYESDRYPGDGAYSGYSYPGQGQTDQGQGHGPRSPAYREYSGEYSRESQRSSSRQQFSATSPTERGPLPPIPGNASQGQGYYEGQRAQYSPREGVVFPTDRYRMDSDTYI